MFKCNKVKKHVLMSSKTGWCEFCVNPNSFLIINCDFTIKEV
nr:hypothetical protein FYQYKPKK_FYQYKPKK_CDS_0003 [Microvirus sp.]